ncbi:MAG: addiction module protein [Desulfobacterales bacterium]|nr:addiction module protein [Desulfobacterales bacterium]
MQVTLLLEKMSTEEKIQTMETLWEDLCKKADSLSSPLWHKDILQEREEMIKNGDDEFVDWENAKNHIRNTVA